MHTPEDHDDANNETTSSQNEEVGQAREFERLSTEKEIGLVQEYIQFLRHNKKWWLAPILLVTVLMIGLAMLSASPAAPFIYTLF